MKLQELHNQLEIFGLEKVHMKSGNVMAQCPFHNDRNPSFGAHPDRGASCFSCHASFHTIEDLFDALAYKTGIEYNRDKLFKIKDDYQRPPQILNENMLDQYDFDVDYFTEVWGINRDVAEHRGLCLDPFTGAECFPIRDRHLNFWGLVERIPPSKMKRSFYKYPRDFKKSDILIGEDIHSNHIWLVEGIRDLCAVESKVPNTTAYALGTSRPSKNQLELLRYYDSIVLALDNDESGEKGKEILIDNLPLDGLKIAKYEGKDPCEAEKFNVVLPTER